MGISLPQTGTKNWGYNLNEAIRRLQSDVNVLQNDVAEKGLDDTQNYTAFLGSGIVWNENSKIGYDKINTIRIQNVDAYFIGESRKSFSIDDESRYIKGSIKLPCYVYLQYDNSNPTSLDFSIYTSQSFSTHWKRIMIGVIDSKNNFIKKVFTPYKTAMQHLDEDRRRRAEIRCEKFYVNNLHTENPIITATGFDSNNSYYYADGVNPDYYIEDENVEERRAIESSAGTWTVNTILVDSIDNTTKKLTTSQQSLVPTDNLSNIFRILYTIDGQMVLQFSHFGEDSNPYKNSQKYFLMESYARNVAFCNDIEQYAIGYVEIARGIYYPGGEVYEISDLNGLDFIFDDELLEETQKQKNIDEKIITNIEYIQKTYISLEIIVDSNGPEIWVSSNDGADMYIYEDGVYGGISKLISFTGSYTNANDIKLLKSLGHFYTHNSEGSPTYPNVVLYMSNTNGLPSLPGASLYLTNNTTIDLSKMTFTADGSSNNFDITLENNNDQTNKNYIYTIPTKNKTEDSYFLTNNYEREEKDGGSINFNVPELVLNNLSVSFEGNGGDEDAAILLGGVNDYDKIKFETDIEAPNIDISAGGAITYISDRRHKENIKPHVHSCTDIVNNTPIVDYNYKKANGLNVGIISQDLIANIPSVYEECFIQTVQESQLKDCKRLKETKLVYILWKALQETNERLRELEEKYASKQ